jgi:elongation factor P--(R)-beta-lysine ligase
MKTWQKIKNNPSLLPQYLIREQVIDGIRTYFKQQGFHEVETPLLVASPGTEPYLDVFETELQLQEENGDRIQKKGHLLTSPEYALKKLLAAGLGNIFEICKSFRNNEGRSSRHNPEFTIVEWYHVNADYTDVMTDCEQLLTYLVTQIKKSDGKKLVYQGKEYNLTTPWPRISVAEAFQKYVGVSTDDLLDREALASAAQHKGYHVTAETNWDDLFYQLFLNEIEPQLAAMNSPVFVHDYPVSQAALSEKKKDDPRFAERFELYLAGYELGNAFTELRNAEEQEQRLREEMAVRQQLAKQTYPIDQDFIEALRSGFPPTGGIAVGVDRLVMLLADVPTIEETLFFPVAEVFNLE